MRAVHGRTLQAYAVKGTLHDGVRLGVRRPKTVIVDHEAPDVGAVRDVPGRAVVARRQDPVLSRHDATDRGARTRRARRNRPRDLHEVLIPAGSRYTGNSIFHVNSLYSHRYFGGKALASGLFGNPISA